MRFPLLLAAWLCGFCLAHAGTDPVPEKYRIDAHKEFESLSKQAALEKGEALAKADFGKGIYRVFVYGKRPLDTPEEQKLREQYGIYTVPIAGCLICDGILGAAEGYNRTMKALLLKKFGRDVFEESKK